MRRHATTPSAIRANATPRSSSSRSCSRRHDPAERPGRRDPPLPDHLLRVEERQRVADPDREHRRVDREEERRHGDPRERSPPVGCAPREHDERRQQGDPGRAGQKREPRRRPRLPEPTPLGEQERRHREEQEERLAVHGAEEERRRRDREKEDRCAARPPRRGEGRSAGRAARTRPTRPRARRARRRAGSGRAGAGRARRRGAGRAGRTPACSRARSSRSPRSAGTSRCPTAPQTSIAAPSSWSRELSHSPRRALSAPSNPSTTTSASSQIAARLQRNNRSAGAELRVSSGTAATLTAAQPEG